MSKYSDLKIILNAVFIIVIKLMCQKSDQNLSSLYNIIILNLECILQTKINVNDNSNITIIFVENNFYI